MSAIKQCIKDMLNNKKTYMPVHDLNAALQ